MAVPGCRCRRSGARSRCRDAVAAWRRREPCDRAPAPACAWRLRSCSRTWPVASPETTSASRSQAQSRSSTIGFGARRPSGVAVEDGRAHLRRSASPARTCQQGARRQPDEVQRIGHLRRLVEVVDAPDQAAVGVAPGAEVLEMDIADGEDGSCVRQVRTDLQDRLGPPPIGGAQKDEGALPHLLVLERDVLRDDLAPELLAHPIFVGLHGFADVGHAHASRKLHFLHLYDAIHADVVHLPHLIRACAAAFSSSPIRPPASPGRLWSRMSCARSSGSGASLTRTIAADIVAARRAARMAADSGNYDAVIAAGGDGTIRHVAAALIGTETPLGIIPVGTGNVLAHEIGLAATAGAVAPMLLDGPIATVACAQANAEPFLLMVGAGFDARVLGGARPAPEEPRRQDGLRGTAARGADPAGGHAQRHGRRPSPHRELGRDRQRAPLRRPLRPGAARRAFCSGGSRRSCSRRGTAPCWPAS